MYESDGSIMVYWHALDTPETPTGKLTCVRSLGEGLVSSISIMPLN